MVVEDYPRAVVEFEARSTLNALLGLHSSFDRSMILLQDIVQVLDRPVAATASQDSFFFHSWNRRAVEACLIGVDDAGMRYNQKLWMRA